jgi:hypothetical protein
MVHLHSQILKFTLTAIAFVMMTVVSIVGVKATSGNAQWNEAATNRPVPGKANFVLFRRGAIDTDARADLDTAAEDMALRQGQITTFSSTAEKRTRVIQFAGVIKRQWLEQVKTAGAEIIGYLSNNAYLIRGNAEVLSRVASLDAGNRADDERPVRWMSRLAPMQKIAPELDGYFLAAQDATVAVDIELLDCQEASSAIDYILSVAQYPQPVQADRIHHQDAQAPSAKRFLNFLVLSVDVPVRELPEIAAREEVLFVSQSYAMKLQDERSMQIIAGNLSADKTQPSGTGYMNWLASKGLDTTPDFAVDFGDSGLDRGSTADGLLHPDFLDTQGRSRVVYSKNYAGGNDDKGGHGTIVASVACGLGAFNRTDSVGYLYGLGVDPKMRVGASRIFMDNGVQPFALSYTTVISAAYAAGARISNNSWGNGSNVYDVAAQEYDALVRDAQPGVPGNQEMVVVFSAGNNGPGGHISSPGTAKNVITVAASENYRPEGFDSCDLDGQGSIGPDGANNASDILRYSAGGPTQDGRAKPDLAAPGTHIYGAASQSSGFFATGICPGIPIFQPPSQQYYTWSSGTSLAAPHVTGAAALVRKFFTQRSLLGAAAPSPAMTKAFLINSAAYLTGENAGGTLPQARQGWGLVNLTQAFNNASRRLLDQTQLFTQSGQTYEIQGSLADRSQALRVTLAWTDAPGSLLGAALVNDLDLEIKVGNTILYRGNNFGEQFSVTDGEADHLNNVESIVIRPEFIPSGYEGNFTITVRAANIAGNGVPQNASDLDQDFALVITNITDPLPAPPPPGKKPAITNATYVKKTLTITGRDFTANARVEVNGQVVDMPFTFDATANSLSIKMKAKKLKLKSESDNQLVIIEGTERSQVFTLHVE